jgi:hypothetical protein
MVVKAQRPSTCSDGLGRQAARFAWKRRGCTGKTAPGRRFAEGQNTEQNAPSRLLGSAVIGGAAVIEEGQCQQGQHGEDQWQKQWKRRAETVNHHDFQLTNQ